MSVERLIANLLRVSREDLEGARLLARAGNRNAIYLCEQAAEKLIRAIVSSEGKHAGIKHHLDEIVDLIPDENPLKSLLRKVEYLAAYATTYRYPTAAGRIKPAPSADEVVRAVEVVAAALQAAIVAFGVDPEARDRPAREAGPIR